MTKIAIIGGGRIARVHARSIQQVEGLALAGVYDPAQEQASQFASEFDIPTYPTLDALWSNSVVDAVSVCSPVFVHRDHVVAAARAGKHIFCEKPIALTLPEADEMLAAAEGAGITFMVGHVVRFMPEYARIQELAASGALGDIKTLYAVRISGISDGSYGGWMLQPGKGLAALDTHIHDLDYAHWVMGAVDRVRSYGWQFPTGTWAHATTRMTFASGNEAQAEGSFSVPPGFPFTMYLRVIGTVGAAVFTFEGPDYATATTKSLILYRRGHAPQPLETSGPDPYVAELRAFQTCVREGCQPKLGHPTDARTALALTLAVQQSLETGQEVKIAP